MMLFAVVFMLLLVVLFKLLVLLAMSPFVLFITEFVLRPVVELAFVKFISVRLLLIPSTDGCVFEIIVAVDVIKTFQALLVCLEGEVYVALS